MREDSGDRRGMFGQARDDGLGTAVDVMGHDVVGVNARNKSDKQIGLRSDGSAYCVALGDDWGEFVRAEDLASCCEVQGGLRFNLQRATSVKKMRSGGTSW